MFKLGFYCCFDYVVNSRRGLIKDGLVLLILWKGQIRKLCLGF